MTLIKLQYYIDSFYMIGTWNVVHRAGLKHDIYSTKYGYN